MVDDIHHIRPIRVGVNFLSFDRDQFIVDYVIGKTILHIGCVGNRDFENPLQLRLHNNSSHCLGIDLNQSGIDLMKERFPELNLACADACDPNSNLPVGHYDVVVFGEVLEHLKAPGLALEAFAKYLKDDGVLLITVPNAFGIRNFMSLIARRSEITRTDHYCYYSYVTLGSLLRDCGYLQHSVGYYSNSKRGGWITSFLKNWILNKFLIRLFPFLSEGIIALANKVK